MNRPELTKGRITTAFAVAVFADICEFPITYCEDFGWEWLNLLAKFGDVMLDLIVTGLLTRILGFHWVYVPSFVIGVIPQVDMFPSWVAAVGYVVWERRKQENNQPVLPAPVKRAFTLLAESTLTSLSSSPPRALPPVLTPTTIDVPAQVATPDESAAEKRLRHLQQLRDKNLISQPEFDTKRQQILSEL